MHTCKLGYTSITALSLTNAYSTRRSKSLCASFKLASSSSFPILKLPFLGLLELNRIRRLSLFLFKLIASLSVELACGRLTSRDVASLTLLSTALGVKREAEENLRQSVSVSVSGSGEDSSVN